MIKRTQKERDQEANTNNGRNLLKQNSWKRSIFLRIFCCSNRKVQTNEILAITWGMCTRNRRSKRHSENFHEFLRYSAEICFRTATSPNLTFLQLEVLLGTKKNKNDEERSLK
jgi:hypothetical protein